jgi:hypothetical protein
VATLDDRRQSLFEGLQNLVGWNAYAYLQGAPQLPALMVGAPPEGDLDIDFDDGANYTFTILAIVGGGDWEEAQRLIDPLLAPSGDGSLKDALESIEDLDGQLGELRYSDYMPGRYAEMPVFGCKFTVEVIT